MTEFLMIVLIIYMGGGSMFLGLLEYFMDRRKN